MRLAVLYGSSIRVSIRSCRSWLTCWPGVCLQQLLNMREELKQREAELEKSLEDKQLLDTQVQSLKEAVQNLQTTHTLQVSSTHTHTLTYTHTYTHTYTNTIYLGLKKRKVRMKAPSLERTLCVSWKALARLSGLELESPSNHLICAVIRMKLV